MDDIQIDIISADGWWEMGQSTTVHAELKSYTYVVQVIVALKQLPDKRGD